MSTTKVSLITTLKLHGKYICRLYPTTAAFVLALTAVSLYSTFSSVASSQVAPRIDSTELAQPTDPTYADPRLPTDEAWLYDFAGQPNGPISSNVWHQERGVTVAGYNNELQAYTDRTQNVRIENGRLVIEARNEKLYNRNYTSARIDTRDSFCFHLWNARGDYANAPGTGTWPAAWLFPVDPRYKPAQFGISDSDPMAWALNGEIDFYESVGKIPNENIPAAHSYNSLRRPSVYTPITVPNQYTEFHTYGVIKTENSITFTLDGTPYAQRTKRSTNPLEWPFDQPYYLILNLAIGGKWAGSEGIDTTSAPWKMEVQSISYTPLQ